jgi:protein arginine N-methyltransferase 1
MTYSLNDYGDMIADKARMDPYAIALKRAIRPGSIVLDIGAGTGIHSLLACKFGARRVYAIEPNDVVHLGREVAEAAGCGDRIEFIQDLSTRVTLPERVDVIVSDLRGVLPLFGMHIPSVIDARGRHLAPGGTLIPKSDSLWVALVESSNTYSDIVNPWDLPYGLPMEPAKQIALNNWSHDNADTIRPANLLTRPYEWAVLDYASIEVSDVGCPDVQLEATRDGIAHGWLVWFESELVDGVGFSCSPAQKHIPDVYGRGFFPLLKPVSVSQCDLITLNIQAELIDANYEWRWHTIISSKGGVEEIKADFNQATDFENVLSPERIAESVSGDRPSPTKEAQIDRYILGRIDGTNSYKTIALETRETFPDRFKTGRDALHYIYRLTRQYDQS